MQKVTFRPERNFYGQRQRAFLASVNAEASKPIDRWYCNECGFVPLEEIKRADANATTGTCKCGRSIDEVPF
jgi:hypothetical protein